MVAAEDDRATEKVHAKVLSSADNCEALAFKRRIILLWRRQFLREERDLAFAVFFGSLEEYGANSNFGGVGVYDELF